LQLACVFHYKPTPLTIYRFVCESLQVNCRTHFSYCISCTLAPGGHLRPSLPRGPPGRPAGRTHGAEAHGGHVLNTTQFVSLIVEWDRIDDPFA
jgi:hypothetical protein